MITVERYGDRHVSVRFKYPTKRNIDRIKQIPGARFIDRKHGWRIPLSYIEEFEELFPGEAVYVTPYHELAGIPAPPPPKFYNTLLKMGGPKLKLPLFPFQEFGAKFLAYMAWKRGFGLLGDTVGIGKTPQSIGAAQMLIEKGLVKRVLVICLASLRKQWVREGIQKFTDESAIAIIGDLKKRKNLYQDSLDNNIRYTVISYQTLLSDLEYLKALNFDLVIFDEAHSIKNRRGKTNRAATVLCKPNKKKKYRGIPYVFELTGTPIMNRIEEVYGLFKVRGNEVFGTWEEFCNDFFQIEGKGRSRTVVGYKNLDEFRRIMKFYMLRRTDKEVQMDLPDVRIKWEYVEPTALQKKLFEIVEEDQMSLRELAKSIKNVQKRQKLDDAAQATYDILLAIADDPTMLLLSKSEKIRKKYGAYVQKAKGTLSHKLERALEIIEEIVDSGEKAVVFTKFSRMAKILQAEIESRLDCDTVIYHGGMNDEQKDDAVQKFRNDDDCKVLIGTEAAGTGLNLQCAAFLMNFDLPWNPALLTQRVGRVRRIGQKAQSVTIINMMVEDSFDEHVREIIEEKQNLFDAVAENNSAESEYLAKVSN